MLLKDTNLIILAGGQGTRLQPVLAKGQPKAMANIESSPFLQYQIDWLYQSGIRSITLALGYGADAIIDFILHLKIPADLDIQYITEPVPLGTGGAIRFSATTTDSDPLFVTNGDTIALVNMSLMLESHLASNADITIALSHVDDSSRYGSVTVDTENYVRAFMEKSDSQGPGLVNAGVYLISKKVIDGMQKDNNFSWEKDILPKYCNGRMLGFTKCDRFLDMGTPEALSLSHTFLSHLGS